jgi:hypothetical protein
LSKKSSEESNYNNLEPQQTVPSTLNKNLMMWVQVSTCTEKMTKKMKL